MCYQLFRDWVGTSLCQCGAGGIYWETNIDQTSTAAIATHTCETIIEDAKDLVLVHALLTSYCGLLR